ncbi:DUF2591 family protein (plasmid) [Pseudomonas yamanorum]|nr:DUF2591 family protein [Pseudomonas yamanorum]
MTELVEVKTSELLGEGLNWATFCAIYTGMQPTIHVIEAGTHEMRGLVKPVEFPRAVSLTYSGAYGVECNWNPSGNWEEGGPLIEKHSVCLVAPALGAGWWSAYRWVSGDRDLLDGPTPLIAACRAIVASVLGDTVSVPKELV